MIHFKSPSVIKPNLFANHTKVFLAGGITNCPDWQSEAINLLESSLFNSNIVVFNPRRDGFDTSKKEVSVSQIKWEHTALSLSDAVMFWFPKETLCPITLFELGLQLGIGRKVFVGVHPNYPRKFDLKTQIPLYHSSVQLVHNIPDLIGQVVRWKKS